MTFHPSIGNSEKLTAKSPVKATGATTDIPRSSPVATPARRPSSPSPLPAAASSGDRGSPLVVDETGREVTLYPPDDYLESNTSADPPGERLTLEWV